MVAGDALMLRDPASSKGYKPRMYVRPQPGQSERRVYVLPASLVQAIHQFGYENDCRSEVEAVRRLLDIGLKAAGK